MAIEIKTFYKELDESYDAHDNAATEALLLRYLDQARRDAAYVPDHEGCPSCAPSVNISMDLVCIENELGCFYRGLSRWQEAIEAFDAAQHEMEQYYATEAPEYGVVLLNKAGTYRYMGALQQALDTFEMARKRLEASEVTPADTLAGLYNNIGLVHLDLKQWEDAVAYFERSLPLLGDSEPDQVKRATTYNNLAVAYRKQSKPAQAMDEVGKAIAILQDIDHGENVHYPAALNTRGMLLYDAGQREAALRDFMASAEKTRIIYGENVEYVNACANCAACCEALGRTEEAATWAARERAVREKLFA